VRADKPITADNVGALFGPIWWELLRTDVPQADKPLLQTYPLLHWQGFDSKLLRHIGVESALNRISRVGYTRASSRGST
jgi:hypothetical protein